VIPDSESRSSIGPGSRQLREGCEGGLRRVQAETEVLVGEGSEDVRGLMPVRIPARSDLRAALVLAHADRRDQLYGPPTRGRWHDCERDPTK